MSPTVDAMPGARRVPQMGFTANTSSRGTSVRRSRWLPLPADRPDRSERTLTLEIPTEPGQRRAAIDPTWVWRSTGHPCPAVGLPAPRFEPAGSTPHGNAHPTPRPVTES